MEGSKDLYTVERLARETGLTVQDLRLLVEFEMDESELEQLIYVNNKLLEKNEINKREIAARIISDPKSIMFSPNVLTQWFEVDNDRSRLHARTRTIGRQDSKPIPIKRLAQSMQTAEILCGKAKDYIRQAKSFLEKQDPKETNAEKAHKNYEKEVQQNNEARQQQENNNRTLQLQQEEANRILQQQLEDVNRALLQSQEAKNRELQQTIENSLKEMQRSQQETSNKEFLQQIEANNKLMQQQLEAAAKALQQQQETANKELLGKIEEANRALQQKQEIDRQIAQQSLDFTKQQQSSPSSTSVDDAYKAGQPGADMFKRNQGSDSVGSASNNPTGQPYVEHREEVKTQANEQSQSISAATAAAAATVVVGSALEGQQSGTTRGAFDITNQPEGPRPIGTGYNLSGSVGTAQSGSTYGSYEYNPTRREVNSTQRENREALNSASHFNNNTRNSSNSSTVVYNVPYSAAGSPDKIKINNEQRSRYVESMERLSRNVIQSTYRKGMGNYVSMAAEDDESELTAGRQNMRSTADAFGARYAKNSLQYAGRKLAAVAAVNYGVMQMTKVQNMYGLQDGFATSFLSASANTRRQKLAEFASQIQDSQNFAFNLGGLTKLGKLKAGSLKGDAGAAARGFMAFNFADGLLGNAEKYHNGILGNGTSTIGHAVLHGIAANSDEFRNGNISPVYTLSSVLVSRNRILNAGERRKLNREAIDALAKSKYGASLHHFDPRNAYLAGINAKNRAVSSIRNASRLTGEFIAQDAKNAANVAIGLAKSPVAIGRNLNQARKDALNALKKVKLKNIKVGRAMRTGTGRALDGARSLRTFFNGKTRRALLKIKPTKASALKVLPNTISFFKGLSFAKMLATFGKFLKTSVVAAVVKALISVVLTLFLCFYFLNTSNTTNGSSLAFTIDENSEFTDNAEKSIAAQTAVFIDAYYVRNYENICSRGLVEKIESNKGAKYNYHGDGSDKNYFKVPDTLGASGGKDDEGGTVKEYLYEPGRLSVIRHKAKEGADALVIKQVNGKNFSKTNPGTMLSDKTMIERYCYDEESDEKIFYSDPAHTVKPKLYQIEFIEQTKKRPGKTGADDNSGKAGETTPFPASVLDNTKEIISMAAVLTENNIGDDGFTANDFLAYSCVLWMASHYVVGGDGVKDGEVVDDSSGPMARWFGGIFKSVSEFFGGGKDAAKKQFKELAEEATLIYISDFGCYDLKDESNGINWIAPIDKCLYVPESGHYGIYWSDTQGRLEKSSIYLNIKHCDNKGNINSIPTVNHKVVFGSAYTGGGRKDAYLASVLPIQNSAAMKNKFESYIDGEPKVKINFYKARNIDHLDVTGTYNNLMRSAHAFGKSGTSDWVEAANSYALNDEVIKSEDPFEFEIRKLISEGEPTEDEIYKKAFEMSGHGDEEGVKKYLNQNCAEVEDKIFDAYAKIFKTLPGCDTEGSETNYGIEADEHCVTDCAVQEAYYGSYRRLLSGPANPDALATDKVCWFGNDLAHEYTNESGSRFALEYLNNRIKSHDTEGINSPYEVGYDATSLRKRITEETIEEFAKNGINKKDRCLLMVVKKLSSEEDWDNDLKSEPTESDPDRKVPTYKIYKYKACIGWHIPQSLYCGFFLCGGHTRIILAPVIVSMNESNGKSLFTLNDKAEEGSVLSEIYGDYLRNATSSKSSMPQYAQCGVFSYVSSSASVTLDSGITITADDINSSTMESRQRALNILGKNWSQDYGLPYNLMKKQSDELNKAFESDKNPYMLESAFYNPANLVGPMYLIDNDGKQTFNTGNLNYNLINRHKNSMQNDKVGLFDSMAPVLQQPEMDYIVYCVGEELEKKGVDKDAVAPAGQAQNEYYNRLRRITRACTKVGRVGYSQACHNWSTAGNATIARKNGSGVATTVELSYKTDCSGFASWVVGHEAGKFGKDGKVVKATPYKVFTTASIGEGLSRYTEIQTNKATIKPGDIVCTKKKQHVMVYICTLNNDTALFVHCTSVGGKLGPGGVYIGNKSWSNASWYASGSNPYSRCFVIDYDVFPENESEDNLVEQK